MVECQRAVEIDLPEELKLLKLLQERNNKFAKFTREYDDYKRFRQAVKNKG